MQRWSDYSPINNDCSLAISKLFKEVRITVTKYHITFLISLSLPGLADYLHHRMARINGTPRSHADSGAHFGQMILG